MMARNSSITTKNGIADSPCSALPQAVRPIGLIERLEQARLLHCGKGIVQSLGAYGRALDRLCSAA